MGAGSIAQPKVSCIMIFWNAAPFIDEAIRSVVDQAGVDAWELLLVDDGSTDGSTATAKEWALHDGARIRYLAHLGHRNQGMSASRNLGLQEARGEFVAFLDSDDVWLPSMLVQRIRLLEEHPEAHAVLGPTWTWFGWTGHPLDRRRDFLIELPHNLPLRQPIHPPEIFLTIFSTPRGWQMPGICSLFFRRRALLDIGGFASEFRGMFEDQVLYVKAFLNLTFVLDDRPLTLYRQHGASACAVAEETGEYAQTGRNPALDRFLAWMASYVGERCGTDGPEWRAVEVNTTFEDGGARHTSPWRRLRGRVRLVAERTAPRSAGAIRRAIARRAEGIDARPIVGAWTEQFVGAWASSVRGRVLVAGGSSEALPQRRLVEMLSVETVVETQHLAGSLVGPFDWIVIVPAVFDEMTPDMVLQTCRELLNASGSVLALVPGPELPTRSGRGSPRLRRNELERLARAWFPAAKIDIEPFGGRRSVQAIKRRQDAGRAAVALDHHDRHVEVLTGLSITPRP